MSLSIGRAAARKRAEIDVSGFDEMVAIRRRLGHGEYTILEMVERAYMDGFRHGQRVQYVRDKKRMKP